MMEVKNHKNQKRGFRKYRFGVDFGDRIYAHSTHSMLTLHSFYTLYTHSSSLYTHSTLPYSYKTKFPCNNFQIHVPKGVIGSSELVLAHSVPGGLGTHI